MLGDDPLKIQQRAGHTSFEMTQKYIRSEAVGQVIGAEFPPLPLALQALSADLRIVLTIRKSALSQWRRRELKQIWGRSKARKSIDQARSAPMALRPTCQIVHLSARSFVAL